MVSCESSPLRPLLSDGKAAAGKVLFQALLKKKKMRTRGGKTPLSPQAGIGGGDGSHVLLATLPSVPGRRRAFCSYPIMPGMPLATWVISAICRSWCCSAKGLADGTLFLGVCVSGF